MPKHVDPEAILDLAERLREQAMALQDEADDLEELADVLAEDFCDCEVAEIEEDGAELGTTCDDRDITREAGARINPELN